MSMNIATMTAEQLEEYIAKLEDWHKIRMRTFRALARARRAEEPATEEETDEH